MTNAWKKYKNHVVDLDKFEKIADLPHLWLEGRAGVSFEVKTTRREVFQRHIGLLEMFGARDMSAVQEVMLAYEPTLLNLYRKWSPVFTGTLYYSGTIDIRETEGQTIMSLYVDPDAWNTQTSGAPAEYVGDLENMQIGPFGRTENDPAFDKLKEQLGQDAIYVIENIF
jgi:hypothetical protein